MTPQEQKVLKYLIQTGGRQLGEAVARLGGDRARQGLARAFEQALEGGGLKATGKAFQVEIEDAAWDDGARLLQAMIDHAAGVVGSNTVTREITRLLDEVEAKAGANLYEIYFRLGLHGYR